MNVSSKKDIWIAESSRLCWQQVMLANEGVLKPGSAPLSNEGVWFIMSFNPWFADHLFLSYQLLPSFSFYFHLLGWYLKFRTWRLPSFVLHYFGPKKVRQVCSNLEFFCGPKLGRKIRPEWPKIVGENSSSYQREICHWSSDQLAVSGNEVFVVKTLHRSTNWEMHAFYLSWMRKDLMIYL